MIYDDQSMIIEHRIYVISDVRFPDRVQLTFEGKIR